jgi:hypothetical protein
LIDSIPVLKVPNYAFKNHGDFSFEDKTKEWGMFRPSFSNGAAFADLDNDGDLDYVVNNINDAAFLYENTLYDGSGKKSENNFLRIKLIGEQRINQDKKVTLTMMENAVSYHLYTEVIHHGGRYSFRIRNNSEH